MADQKITALTELTAPLDDDVLPIVSDPAGTPVTKKVTLSKISSPRILATVTGINAKTVAATTLYTVPTGKSLVVDHIVIRVTAFTAGSKSVQAVIDLGTNDPDYNDLSSIAGPFTITVAGANVFLLLGQTDVLSGGAPAVALPVYAAASVFKINVTTGSDATTETWAVDVVGYLV